MAAIRVPPKGIDHDQDIDDRVGELLDQGVAPCEFTEADFIAVEPDPLVPHRLNITMPGSMVFLEAAPPDEAAAELAEAAEAARADGFASTTPGAARLHVADGAATLELYMRGSDLGFAWAKLSGPDLLELRAEIEVAAVVLGLVEAD